MQRPRTGGGSGTTASSRTGLGPVRSWLAAASGEPPVTGTMLDALDLEVRRTVRERRTDHADQEGRRDERAGT